MRFPYQDAIDSAQDHADLSARYQGGRVPFFEWTRFESRCIELAFNKARDYSCRTTISVSEVAVMSYFWSRASLQAIAVCCMTCALPFGAVAQHAHDDASVVQHGTGVVTFENSGAAAAQKDFLLGLAQLHNFQYDAAGAAFRRAQQLDAGFAMAYWGEAMTYNHAIWAQQDVRAGRGALAKLAGTPDARRSKAATAREQAYLNAVDILYGEGEKYERDRRYALAMESLHAAYPNDIDATCFYALALLGTAHAGREVPTYMKSAALMQDVFERYPHHPGAAHYLIHSVDDAAHAPLGLRAANAYANIS